MREFLLALQKRAKENIASIRSKIDAAQTADEVRSLDKQLTDAENELRSIDAQLAKLDADEQNKRSAAPQGGLDPMASYGVKRSAAVGGDQPLDDETKRRLAFANYVTRGVTPYYVAEERQDATTTTTDVAVAIPENLINKIIEKMENVGHILPLVTHTTYPFGAAIPIDGAKPVATWVAEGASSDSQKKEMSGKISFTGFKLRCEIRMTQEVTVRTLPAFEAAFIKQISEGMVKAREAAIISDSDGSVKPTGILYNANEATAPDKKVEIPKLATGHITYKFLCDMEAEVPSQYESTAVWCMTKKTFMTIYGMTDNNGQPIAKINTGINGKPERFILGRPVVMADEYMDTYVETALETDSCFCFIFDFSDYVENTMYDLGIKSKEDWNTEDKKTKGVMSVDGKVLIRDSLVKGIKKSS